MPKQASRMERIWRHPVVRWSERLFWVAIAIFAFNRLGPQLSAWTGIGPALGTVPEYQFTTLEGEVISSSDLKGRTVVLNFWASWCGPCRLEMPALQSIYEDMDPAEVAVIGVSVDVTERPAREYVAERGFTYPIGMVTGDLRRAVGGITAVPTTFIIGPDGVVQHRVLGYFAPPAMRAAVRRIVGRADEPLGVEDPAGE